MNSQEAEQVKVRVLFGQHVIATYVGEPAAAQRYATAMERRFSSLQVTQEPLSRGAERAQAAALELAR